MVRVELYPTGAPGEGVVFDNGRDPIDEGMWLVAGGLEGWYGSPGPREKPTARTGVDGDWAPAVLSQGARTVTLKARARFGSSLALQGVLDQVAGLACRPLTLVVSDEAGVRHCSCHVADAVEPLIYGDRLMADMTLVLCAPDPYRYGPAQTVHAVNGVAEVVNPGSLPVWPRVHVAGYVTGLALSYGGRSVTWTGDAASLDLDLRDMIPSTGAVGVDDGFRLPPGSSRVSVGVTPDADVSLTIEPAWR